MQRKDSWDLFGSCNRLPLSIISLGLHRWLTHLISTSLCLPPSHWATDGIHGAIPLSPTPDWECVREAAAVCYNVRTHWFICAHTYAPVPTHTDSTTTFITYCHFFKCQLLFTYVLITCDVALSHGVSCLLSFVVQLCEGESVTRVTLSVFVISCQTFVQLKSLLCLIARQKCGRCFPYAYLQTATAGSWRTFDCCTEMLWGLGASCWTL